MCSAVSSVLSRNPPQTSPCENASEEKGFSSVMDRIIDYHTYTWSKQYRWERSHVLRQVAVRTYGKNFLAQTIGRFYHYRQACTYTAFSVFSIFVERAYSTSFGQQTGVEFFLSTINKVKGLQKQRGLAFFCTIGSPERRCHYFVIERTPTGRFFIYQSYQHEYSLREYLKRQKAMNEEELLSKLRQVASPTIFEHTPERDKAYQDLFGATYSTFKRLDFFFEWIEYKKDAVPKVPQFTICDHVEHYAEKILPYALIGIIFLATLKGVNLLGNYLIRKVLWLQ